MMEELLEGNGVKDFINTDISQPLATNDQLFDAWKKNVANKRRIMLEGVRDHIVSNLHGKETPYAMWKALIYFFQNNSEHKKLDLKENPIRIKMEEGDIIPKYLTKFTQCQHVRSVDVTIVEDDLVSLTLLGISKS